MKENFWFSNKISLKYVLLGLIDNKPVMVKIMDCHPTDNKPMNDSLIYWHIFVLFTDKYIKQSASIS